MKYNIQKNWISSFDLIRKKPVVLLPFIFIGFFEGLALELIYFSTRSPISVIAAPVIRKLFGEGFIHYPGNLVILPKLFYYAQVAVYIFIGVFLTAICANIVKNAKSQLPLKASALIKNASKRYLAFFVFGIIAFFLMAAIKRTDLFIVSKFMRLVSRYLPLIAGKLDFITLILILFFSNIILQVFLVLTVPIIVIEKKSLIRALGSSIYLGFRNFFSLFGLIFLPFLLYLPILLLQGKPALLADKTFPEINVCITAVGIVIILLADCFVTVCASNFVLDKGKAKR